MLTFGVENPRLRRRQAKIEGIYMGKGLGKKVCQCTRDQGALARSIFALRLWTVSDETFGTALCEFWNVSPSI